MKRHLGAAFAALLIPAARHAACTASATGVAFGLYDPSSSAPKSITGTVTLTCDAASGTGAYTVALSIGGGGSYGARQLNNGTAVLSYQLYRDSSHSTIWGDGTGGSFVATGTDNLPSTGGSVNFQVYGLIAASQAPRPGGYTDPIIVTISY